MHVHINCAYVHLHDEMNCSKNIKNINFFIFLYFCVFVCLCVCCVLKLGVQRAVSAALVQVVPLLLAGANAPSAGRVVTGAAFGFDRIFSKNEKFARWKGDFATGVILSHLGVVLVANLVRIFASRIFPVVASGNPAVHVVIYGSPQCGSLHECFLNHTSNIGGHAIHGK